MNKLWLGLLFVLLLALLLAVILTATFLYKDRKERDKKEKSEVVWNLHVEADQALKLKGTLERVLKVDLSKTQPYTVDGFKFTPGKVSHKFGDVKVEGYVHRLDKPVNLRKVVVGSNTITPRNLTKTHALTILSKDGGEEFVTLWVNGTFNHYTTKGAHLAAGAFPFAEGDVEKHPSKLGLPVGEEVVSLAPAAAVHVPKVAGAPEAPVVAAEVPVVEAVPEPVVPEARPALLRPVTREELKAYSVDVEVDLDVLFFCTEDQPYTYQSGNHTMTVHLEKFNEDYKRLVYRRDNGGYFNPTLKLEGTKVKLTDAEVMDAMYAYFGSFSAPLALTFVDVRSVVGWFHRGKNQWERSNFSVLTTRMLDEAQAWLNEFAIFDVSVREGSYSSAKLEVRVHDSTESDKRFDGLKSYTHTLFNATTGLTTAAQVYKYNRGAVVLNGLSKTVKVSAVTVYFWEHDYAGLNPLLIRLHVGKDFMDYYGHNNYALESDADMLAMRLARLNCELNRVVTVSLDKKAKYSFSGLVSTSVPFFTFSDVTVVEEPYPLNPHFKKFVHRLELHVGERVPFSVHSLVGHPDFPPQKNVDAVEVFFVDGFPSAPLAVNFKRGEQNHLFHKVGDRLEKSDFGGSLHDALTHVAYHELGFVTLDLTKTAPYHYNGCTSVNFFAAPTVSVQTLRSLPSMGFTKMVHTVATSAGTSRRAGEFRVLELKGVNVGFGEVLTSVEAYFFEHDLTDPVFVVLRGPRVDKLFALDGAVFVPLEVAYLSDLELRLKWWVAKKRGVLYLDFDAHQSYFLNYGVYYDAVYVREGIVAGRGFKVYTHSFNDVKSVRFTARGMYFDPSVDLPVGPYRHAVLVTDEAHVPIFVTLMTADNRSVYYKYVGRKLWEKSDPAYASSRMTAEAAKLLVDDAYAQNRQVLANGLSA